jgi:sigma-B regulation protein RsbQ
MEIFRNGVKINYTDTGKGDIPIIFVHGSFLDSSYWIAQIKAFKTQYRIIALDLPGQGESGKNRKQWSIEDFAHDVSEIIYQLDLQNVILVGHSIGANIVLELAATHPQRIIGIIAIEAFRSAGEMPEEVEKQVDVILKNLREHYEDTCEMYARQGLLTARTSKEIQDKIVGVYRTSYRPMGVASVESLFRFSDKERGLFQKLKFKLHLINVNFAPTNEDLLKKYCNSNYDLTIIDGTCHFPMLENPDELNRALEKAFHKIVVHAREHELSHHQ